MIRYQNPLAKKGLFIRSSRGDATISVILAIILISGVFLTGGVLPHMEDDTLKKDTTAVVQGIKSEDESGNSFIASTTTGSDTKRSIQMKQLVLITATPTPTGTPIPTPTPIATSSSGDTWSITYTKINCGTLESGLVGETGTVTIAGPVVGYMVVEIEKEGVFATIQTSGFTPPTNTYTAKLPNLVGFNTSNWRIRAHSGGIYNSVDKIWSGGTFKVNYDGQPTGC